MKNGNVVNEKVIEDNGNEICGQAIGKKLFMNKNL